jgi:hypothetical protein
VSLPVLSHVHRFIGRIERFLGITKVGSEINRCLTEDDFHIISFSTALSDLIFVPFETSYGRLASQSKSNWNQTDFGTLEMTKWKDHLHEMQI